LLMKLSHWAPDWLMARVVKRYTVDPPAP